MRTTTGVGRTYRFYNGVPLWPFGFGGSYTTFTVAWANGFSPSTPVTVPVGAVDTLTFAVTVTNTGSVFAGSKVVQFYVAALDVPALAGLVLPRRSLWAMNKVHLKPRETSSRVHAFANASDWCPFCTVDAEGNRAVRAGTYLVTAGGHGGSGSGADCPDSDGGGLGGAGDDGGGDGGGGVGGGGSCTSVRVQLTGDTVASPLW